MKIQKITNHTEIPQSPASSILNQLEKLEANHSSKVIILIIGDTAYTATVTEAIDILEEEAILERHYNFTAQILHIVK